MTTQVTDRAVLELMARFGDAFNGHDLDKIMDCMTDDCVFIARDGERFEGNAAVRAHWSERLAEVPDMKFEQKDYFICGDRAFYEWKVTFTNGGKPVEMNSCDIFTYREGKIAVKDYYVRLAIRLDVFCGLGMFTHTLVIRLHQVTGRAYIAVARVRNTWPALCPVSL